MSALTRAIEGRNAPSEPTPPLHTGDIAYDAIGEVWLYQPVDFRGPHELVPAAKIGGGGSEVGPTPPDSPNEGDFWWNTAVDPDQLFIFAGGAWQPVVTPTDLSGVLHLTGGTMTGPLVLSGDATSPLNPVTYQQLQANYLPLAGGTMTGGLVINSAAGLQIRSVGLPSSNPGGSQVWQGSNGALIVGTGPAGGGFLPLGGGTVTGNLQVSSANLSLTNTAGQLLFGASAPSSPDIYFKLGTSRTLTLYTYGNNKMIDFYGTNGIVGFYYAPTFAAGLNTQGTPIGLRFISGGGQIPMGITWQWYGVDYACIGPNHPPGSSEIRIWSDTARTQPIIGFSFASWGTPIVTANQTTTMYGPVKMTALPTTDPHVAGTLWNNAGDLMISLG